MTLDWLAGWWVFAAAIMVVFAPGAIAALVIGLRGFTTLAAAAPLSLAVIGAASLVNAVVPFRWGVVAWVVAAAALIVAAVAVALVQRRIGSRWWREDSPLGRWRSWLPFVAVAVAVVLILPRELSVFGEPQNISQTFDNVYHLNAVRYILDTGTIAPTEQLIPGFYPSLWHSLVATVVAVSGAAIPVAVNVVSAVLAALIWPISLVYLVRQISGPRTGAMLITGVLAAGMWTFPYLMLDYGVLYPNALSIALLPAVLGALLTLTGLGAGPRPPTLLSWILLLSWVPTLALAHPSSLMAFFAIGLWPAAHAFARWLRRPREASEPAPRGKRAAILTLWILGFVTAGVLLLVARPRPDQAFWGPWQDLGSALVSFVTNGIQGQPWALAISSLMIIGIVAALLRWRRLWWLVAGWATIGFIYVVCTSFPEGAFRYGITGTWYSDSHRISALVPVVVIPLAAVGFGALVDLIVGAVRTKRVSSTALAGVLAVVGAAAVLVATQLNPTLERETASGRALYDISDESPLLTTDERALIERLPEQVPADDVIVGSPWTGASLSYALANRIALIPHIYEELTPDMRLIVGALDQASDDPEVCAALERTDTRWVLDFGQQEIHGGDHAYPGLSDLASVATLVDSEGPDARLYRITACS